MFSFPCLEKGALLFPLLVIIFLFFSFLCVPSSGYLELANQVSDSEDFDIIWVVDEELTSSLFPLCFFVRDSANISLTSSWGYAENITLKKKSMLWNNPSVEWIELPDSSVGMGNLSIYHENDQLSVHNVTWNRPCSPVGAPISIRLVHDWFSYFIGKTRLILEFFSNGSVSIDHIVMSSKWPEHLPYNQSFSFTSNFPLSVWFEFVDYLEDNQSYSWQSWVYDSPEGGWVDQWGFLSTLTIEWNATTQKVITEMVDNDSGSGDRIYVTPTTSAFIKRLLNISDDIIAKTILVEAETTETTESTPLSPKIVVFSAFFVLVLFRKKRKFFGGTFR